MNRFLFAIFLVVPGLAFAWDQTPPLPLAQCRDQAPYGFPQTTKPGVGICRHAYVLLSDTQAKIPVWASYSLTPKNAIGCVVRSNAFAPDASLPKGQRAELSDYAKSGYDQGHNVPGGDMSFNNLVEHESFLMSNMAPQTPQLNRGIWKLLETSVRAWSYERNHTMVVYIANIYNAADKTIGDNKVVVPHSQAKVVIDKQTNEYAAWLFPNIPVNMGNDLTKYRATLAEVEKQSGVMFPIPAGGTELSVGKEWPVDFGMLTKTKRTTCGTQSDE